MSVWITNLRSGLRDKPVLILHGNVRDRYIDPADHSVYSGLNDLIEQVTADLGMPFMERVVYDAVGQERRTPIRSDPEHAAPASPDPPPPTDDLAGTRPPGPSDQQRVRSTSIFANWLEQMQQVDVHRLYIVYYLDKVVAYRTSYQDDEKETLLRLEKLIENIGDGHRLILVALQDTQLPLELYTHAPKVRVLPIPMPDKDDRRAWLAHRLDSDYPQPELAADLTDGLYLHELDTIAQALHAEAGADPYRIRQLINRYRLGEQEDYWGKLALHKLDGAGAWLQEDIKGQDEAIARVVDMLILARAGLTGMAGGTAAKPKGVLFFAGPTGVGKTFVAKKLAEFLFSTQDAFIRFDMSEMKEEHTVSKLIGSPPGYVGYERGGMLTNAVRERPFAVLLFDEIEKAHPKLFDIFLQLLDEGRLTDSRGQTVFFTETVIVFTSNIGARALDSQNRDCPEQAKLQQLLQDGTDDAERQHRLREHFRQAVETFFLKEIARPELLNRIGNNIIPFNYIDGAEVQQEIVRSHLRRIQQEFADKYRQPAYRLHIDDRVVGWLVQRYGQRISQFGGRGITNALNDEIMLPLAWAVLDSEQEQARGCTFRLDLAEPDGPIAVQRQ